MKIYTKKGDKGKTSLFGGLVVSKADAQIEAYGTVDELNSFIGLLISKCESLDTTLLKRIQSVLFDIGSHLSSDNTADKYLPQLDKQLVLDLESAMDEMTKQLLPLKSFIMPGGNERISIAHVCRTICRRAERRAVTLHNHKEIPEAVIIILNRLSDYFFVFSRYISMKDGIDEVKWNPK